MWFAAPDLAALNRAQRATLSGHLGIVFTEVGADFLRATMPVDARTLQPMGLLHGGASVALAESLGSTAANLCVDRSRYRCVGQEINANHLRAVRDGDLVTGTTRPLHLGKRSQVWNIEIVDRNTRLVCVSRLTMAVIEHP
ncbi:MAG: hotdog fold thioesterase [Gammaproteobacteria bacterium]|nr:hotdog fold thioesterase [Gammaproteobacteria bacterium]